MFNVHLFESPDKPAPIADAMFSAVEETPAKSSSDNPAALNALNAFSTFFLEQNAWHLFYWNNQKTSNATSGSESRAIVFVFIEEEEEQSAWHEGNKMPGIFSLSPTKFSHRLHSY